MWRIEPSAVYYTIWDDNGALICFMGMGEHDYKNAELIVKLHNENLKSNGIKVSTNTNG